MAVLVLNLSNDQQSVDGIEMMILDKFKELIRVCVISQNPLLIFRDLKEVMRLVSMRQVRLNYIGGTMMILILL
jgi:hypothetical protein